MAWLYVPGLTASDSDWESPFPDTGLAARWREKPLRPQSWSRVKKTAPSLRFLSGIVLPPSTVDLGVERFRSSMREYPVSPGPSPESSLEPPTRDGSGPTCYGLSERSSRESSFWKRCGVLFKEAWDWSSETLPISGMWDTTIFSAHPRSGHPIKENAASPSAFGGTAWPTPDANTASYSNGQFGMNIREAATAWPSPRSEDSECCGNHPGATDSLTGATKEWAMPDANTASYSNGKFGPNIREQAALWQTPATDSFHSRGGDRKDEMGLDQQARSYPTPSARDWKDGRASEETTESNARPLNEFVLNEMENWPTPRVTTSAMEPSEAQLSRIRSGEESERGAGACKLEISASLFSRPDPPTPQDGADSSPITPGSRRPSARKKLNAYFVEMLMGLPPGWTSMLPLGQIDSER